MRRAGAVVLLALALAGVGAEARAASPATERAARHREEVRRKIACRRAARQGRPCQAPARPAPGPGRPGPAAATPGSPETAPATQGALIEVSLAEQTLRAWEGGRVVLSAVVSTGAPGAETPTGRFRIQSKEQMHWSNRFRVWMPRAMRVVGGIFIHELPLTRDGRRIGAGSLGRPVSHGCIRLAPGPAAWLFAWARVGTPVWIH